MKSTRQPHTVLEQLRRAVLLQGGAALSDAELLEGYIARRDEDAFEVLLRRHGPMVLGVCRRILGNDTDAEDAFQATFLVLVRKAASVKPRALVGNFLYGVAHNTALKARAITARRRTRERQVEVMPQPRTPDDAWQQIQPVLDEELNGLPEKYRVALVLCDLEGKTRAEAARQLGWAEGTVASRVARGRSLLARRLTRHGLALSSGGVAAALAQGAVAASLPAPLMMSTLKAATLFAAGNAVAAGAISLSVAALTEGVLKAMFLTKLKFVTTLLVFVGVVGLGVGKLTYGTAAAQPGPENIRAADEAARLRAENEQLKKELKTVLDQTQVLLAEVRKIKDANQGKDPKADNTVDKLREENRQLQEQLKDASDKLKLMAIEVNRLRELLQRAQPEMDPVEAIEQLCKILRKEKGNKENERKVIEGLSYQINRLKDQHQIKHDLPKP
jgi:RNA polymerase sigma factor (sigma-70 family)